jgi:predicted O-linked N-acetylglucosamine transferase (SPINDLY family)
MADKDYLEISITWLAEDASAVQAYWLAATEVDPETALMQLEEELERIALEQGLDSVDQLRAIAEENGFSDLYQFIHQQFTKE